MQRYQDYILNSNGQPVSGASVIVRANGTATDAATIYSTNSGTDTRANPLTSDANGHIWFYGTNGRYDLVISGSYISTTTAADVMLEDVPLSNLAELSTASSARTNLGLGSAAVVSTATFLKGVNNLSDITTAATARANLGLALGTDVQAYDAAIAKTTNTNSWTKGQSGAVVVLASTGQITPDFSAANNFSLSLSANTTLAAGTNAVVGHGGTIVITQAATANTLVFNSFWKWAGTATATISTATGTVDILAYHIYSTSAALCTLHKGIG